MDRLTIRLCPHWADDTVKDMTVISTYPASGFKQDDEKPSLEYPDDAFGGLCPFPEWSELAITDDNGELPYELKDSAGLSPAAKWRGIWFKREPEGTVNWKVTLLPRVLPEGYVSSPYYDFRAEPFGLNGSGMFTFILPSIGIGHKMLVDLDWDLTDMPGGARGIWSYGEGHIERELDQWETMLTLYNTGVMQSVESDCFGVYWFSEPDFDVRSIAEKALPIYLYEREFFGDDESFFRVFIRRDPFEKSEGGSACPYAFISGYSAFGNTDADNLFRNLIHEMTHTWPAMVDFNVGEGTWFTEGATEYYSTLVPYWGGFLDAEFTADSLNDKITRRYLDNVHRELPNDQIPAIQWQDRRAQTVPYGRGFYYLANLEAKLKRLGKGSIDEIVKKHNQLDPITPDEWKEFVYEKLGDEGIKEFEDMKAGIVAEPESDMFGPEIITLTHTVEIDGKEVKSWHWEAVK